MRPGQLTPENVKNSPRPNSARDGFNEAGAINPGKPRVISISVPFSASFNEAGAINPGKPGTAAGGGLLVWGFNEAGAINPGKPEGRTIYPDGL